MTFDPDLKKINYKKLFFKKQLGKLGMKAHPIIKRTAPNFIRCDYEIM